jgi:general secretion pathway protein G
MRSTARKTRARSRGLTLVELVIVITILGVLTAAISVGLMAAKKSADIGTAKTACNTIRSATTVWKQAHPGEDCPTLDQLRQEKNLDKGFVMKDAWGNSFKLTCETDDIICTTAGPDKKEGTEDDIIVPAPDNAPGH